MKHSNRETFLPGVSESAVRRGAHSLWILWSPWSNTLALSWFLVFFFSTYQLCDLGRSHTYVDFPFLPTKVKQQWDLYANTGSTQRGVHVRWGGGCREGSPATCWSQLAPACDGHCTHLSPTLFGDITLVTKFNLSGGLYATAIGKRHKSESFLPAEPVFKHFLARHLVAISLYTFPGIVFVIWVALSALL